VNIRMHYSAVVPAKKPRKSEHSRPLFYWLRIHVGWEPFTLPAFILLSRFGPQAIELIDGKKSQHTFTTAVIVKLWWRSACLINVYLKTGP